MPSGSGALRVAFGEPVEVLATDTLDQVKAVLQAVEERALRGQCCVGYVRYEAAPAFDHALAVHATTGPLVWFGVHDAPLPQEPSGDVVASSPEAAPTDVCRATWHNGMTRATFDAAMARLHQAIADGEIYQANFTTRTAGQLQVPPLELFAAMRQAQPGGFAAYIDTGEEQVLSVSPELFFDWHDGHLITRPMKGTAPRDDDPQTDAALALALRTSPKERAENVMIVDLIRNDLSRIAKPFSVTVDGLCRVQALTTVWQMVSDVHADTRPGTRLVDVFGALFPCGSVTGAPKVQAMRLIRELEDTPRGVYCGAVGVVRPGGNATFNVPIARCLNTESSKAHHAARTAAPLAWCALAVARRSTYRFAPWRHMPAPCKRAPAVASRQMHRLRLNGKSGATNKPFYSGPASRSRFWKPWPCKAACSSVATPTWHA